MNLLFQKYGKLPEDYQIVGFDNSPIANEAILPITTIGQQIDKIAKTAMELLILQMDEIEKKKNYSFRTSHSQTNHSCSDSP